jgi:hypothetical protein
MNAPRRLGTAKQAAAEGGPSPGTLRNWLKKGHIGAVRRGPRGPFLYDLDEVAAISRIEYGPRAEERLRAHIRELVAAVPDLTDEQVAAIRPLLHAGPASPPPRPPDRAPGVKSEMRWRTR